MISTAAFVAALLAQLTGNPPGYTHRSLESAIGETICYVSHTPAELELWEPKLLCTVQLRSGLKVQYVDEHGPVEFNRLKVIVWPDNRLSVSVRLPKVKRQ